MSEVENNNSSNSEVSDVEQDSYKNEMEKKKNWKTFYNIYSHINLSLKNRVTERIYLMLMEGMDDNLMKKVGGILIKTIQQDQITGGYVRTLRLKIVKLMLYATKKLRL